MSGVSIVSDAEQLLFSLECIVYDADELLCLECLSSMVSDAGKEFKMCLSAHDVWSRPKITASGKLILSGPDK